MVDPDDDTPDAPDPRDYDVEYYARQLRETYAARLARAFTPPDFASLFADPEQLLLMPPSFDTVRTVLTPRGTAPSL